MKKFIKLQGSAARYNLDGQTYEVGKVYSVPEARALILTRKKDHLNRPFFVELTAEEVEVQTGVSPADPKPVAPKPTAELVESDETEGEAEQAAQDAANAEEAAEADSEEAITDPEVDVIAADPDPVAEFADDQNQTEI